jgi:RIO kinase 1
MQKIEITNVLSEFTGIFSDIELIARIKTGKEAEVFLVEADGQLMALKCYRPNIKYASRHDYLGLGEIGDSRMRRAIKNKTRIGKKAIEFIWSRREYDVLTKLAGRGALVPEVYGFSSNSVLMQYLGDAESPALRLAETELSKQQAEKALEQIVDTVEIMLELDYVHGDLSEFNVLYHKGDAYVIDFPQVVHTVNNQFARTALEKDVANLRKFFAEFKCANLYMLDRLAI